jgi:NTE family protein
MQSIGFQFGLSDVIPIYWKLSGEARYTYSPSDFFTVNAAVAAGLDAYHNEGHGYVYPESFDYRVLDNCFRQHVKATPWSSEWYNPDLASHHYGLVRMNMGLHRGWVGAWIFGAYVHDYEENPSALLGENKFVLEPALRFAYKSISAYAGMSRIVDNDGLGDFKKLGSYQYFVRIGNYDLF